MWALKVRFTSDHRLALIYFTTMSNLKDLNETMAFGNHKRSQITFDPGNCSSYCIAFYQKLGVN